MTAFDIGGIAGRLGLGGTIPKLMEALKDVTFPIDKTALIKLLIEKGVGKDVMGSVNNIPDRRYDSVQDVATEAERAIKAEKAA